MCDEGIVGLALHDPKAVSLYTSLPFKKILFIQVLEVAIVKDESSQLDQLERFLQRRRSWEHEFRAVRIVRCIDISVRRALVVERDYSTGKVLP